LVTGVTEELDPYSRWIGRNPEGRGTLPAAALLPVDLLNDVGGEVAALRTWVDELLAGDPIRVVDADQVLDKWPKTNPVKMTRQEAVSFATLLGRFGVGIEPDVRLGGPVLSEGPVVLFRIGPSAPNTASQPYAAAATLLHIAVAVAAADGIVSKDEHDHLVAHMQSALQLTADEKVRLDAHLQWMVTTGVKLTGLTKRLEALSTSQRSTIGDFVITVAAADGVVSPDEVKTLMKIYKLLGLEQESVHSRIHHHLAEVHTRRKRLIPDTEPVTVRTTTAGHAGYTFPNIPSVFHAAVPVPVDSQYQREGSVSEKLVASSVMLDEAVIAEKLAESAQISAVLADIFAENDEPTTIVAAGSGPTAFDGAESPTMVKSDAMPVVELVADLDLAHSCLIRALAKQPTWSASEYALIAEQFGVMPAGALEVVNNAAIEICGEPFAEGGDDSEDIEINDYARQELLR
jgi:tellurite resistance protein